MNNPKYEISAPNSSFGVVGDYATVNQIYIQSPDYQKLIKDIEDKKEYLECIPETKQTLRLKLSSELENLEKQLEEFKENVFKLYETFTKIKINTERLKQAKAYFDKGEFREADAILKAEDMVKDLNKLIEKDKQLDQEKAEVRQNREQIANEFLIKARLWATFYEERNRLEQTCEYFEEALRAYKTSENLFEYAFFLGEHNKFNQAISLYQEALEIRRELAKENPSAYLPNVANTLNNLAILHRVKNELAQAQREYEEALEIRRELAKENPSVYLPDVAMTMTNLAVLFQDEPEKSIVLAREIIEIALQFQQLPRVQKYAEKASQILEKHGLNPGY